eukprot:1378863-Amorphochlora_amoeboformis.AAC.1
MRKRDRREGTNQEALRVCGVRKASHPTDPNPSSKPLGPQASTRKLDGIQNSNRNLKSHPERCCNSVTGKVILIRSSAGALPPIDLIAGFE